MGLVLVTLVGAVGLSAGCGEETSQAVTRSQASCNAGVVRFVASAQALIAGTGNQDALAEENTAAMKAALSDCPDVATFVSEQLKLNGQAYDNSANRIRAVLSDTICPREDPSTSTAVCADLAGVEPTHPPEQATDTSAPVPQREGDPITAKDVVTAFGAAGLEAGSPTPMAASDYGRGPVVGQGLRFLVPSICSDCGGRVVTGTSDELKALKRYYDSFGGRASALFSWTFLNEAAGVLVQINGELPEDQAAEYEKVVQGL
jgi:hypothetical protein